MKKIISILTAAIFLITVASITVSAGEKYEEPAGEFYGDEAPAPESGDGDPEGSGFDHNDPIGPAEGEGPAPNSGDGIPDGSGL